MGKRLMRLSWVLLAVVSVTVRVGAQSIPQYEIEEFDFSLVKPPQFFFAVISDTHVTPSRQPYSPAKILDPELKFELWGPYCGQLNNPKFEMVVRQINATRPAFMRVFASPGPCPSTDGDYARR